MLMEPIPCRPDERVAHARLLETCAEHFASNLLPRPASVDSRGFSNLTSTERLVVVHLKFGLSNKEICAALGKSEATVKNQVASILRKLGVPSRARLVALLWWLELSARAPAGESCVVVCGSSSSRLPAEERLPSRAAVTCRPAWSALIA